MRQVSFLNNALARFVHDCNSGSGDFTAFKADLVVVPIPPSLDTDPATLTIASYPAYAQATVLQNSTGTIPSVGTPRLSASGFLYFDFPLPSSGPAVPAYGVLLTYESGGSPPKVCALPFDAEIVLPPAGGGLSVLRVPGLELLVQMFATAGTPLLM